MLDRQGHSVSRHVERLPEDTGRGHPHSRAPACCQRQYVPVVVHDDTAEVRKAYTSLVRPVTNEP